MLINYLVKLGNPARNATSASLIIIASVAMYKWTITPQSGYLSAAKGYETAMNKVFEQNTMFADQVEARKKKLQELKESSSQLQSALFTDSQAKEFFSDLQVVAEQAGCVVQSTNFITEKARSENNHLGIETKSADISVVGVYQNIENLVGRLQARDQKVWIDSIRMRAVDQNSDTVICDLTVTICHIKERPIL
jgi:Tfp pilus assembly protein PilO